MSTARCAGEALLLEFSRRFHIYDTNYNKGSLAQEKFVWRMWENLRVEAVVCLDKRIGAAEMF